jgi:hypothetical protein
LNDILQQELATQTYLEALISILSQYRSLGKWITIDKNSTPHEKSLVEFLEDVTDEYAKPGESIKPANAIQCIAVEQLQILLLTRTDLFKKFKELGGFKLVVDVMANTESETVQHAVMSLLGRAANFDAHYATALAKLGVIEHMSKISKECKSEDTREVALNTLSFLSLRLPNAPTNLKLNTMPEQMLQSIISSPQVLNKMQSMLALLGMGEQPEVQECLQKHLKDGKTQAVFKHILVMRKDVLAEYLHTKTYWIFILLQ